MPGRSNRSPKGASPAGRGNPQTPSPRTGGTRANPALRTGIVPPNPIRQTEPPTTNPNLGTGVAQVRRTEPANPNPNLGTEVGTPGISAKLQELNDRFAETRQRAREVGLSLPPACLEPGSKVVTAPLPVVKESKETGPAEILVVVAVTVLEEENDLSGVRGV